MTTNSTSTHSATNPVPTVSLRAGDQSVTMPQLGFGVWQVEDDAAPAAITAAFETGYRSIDTAKIYGNEDGVGRAFADTNLERSELFLTTKVWNDDQGYDATLRAFEASAKRLGTSVDLYLIHWPVAGQDKYVDTFRALIELRNQGKIRVAGVCNFQIEHLQRVYDELGEFPAINQIEVHPLLQQKELRDFHAANGIVTEAWSPLAQGGELLHDQTLAEIASATGKSIAQVILRWHIQLGNVVIPKSVTPARIAENFDIFDFELTDEQMAEIESLNKNERKGPNPDEFGA